MRTILTIAALFSLTALVAQPPVAEGRMPSRGVLLPAASAAEAAAPESVEQNRYRATASEWTVEGQSYRATFTRPFAWANRRVILRLAHVPEAYRVRVNGRDAGSDSNGNIAAEFDITKLCVEGRNVLEITPTGGADKIESWKAGAAPVTPARATLSSPPTMWVRDVVLSCRDYASGSAVVAEVAMVVRTGSLNARTSTVNYELLNPRGESITAGSESVTIAMRGEDTIRIVARIPDADLWSPASPQMHTLRIKTQHEGRNMEFLEVPLGIRSIAVDGGTLILNGERMTLRSREITPQDALPRLDGLRDEGYNLLRLLPATLDEEFLAECDRAGMMVIVQAPVDTRHSGPSRRKGSNPTNDPAWSAEFADRAVNIYHATKRHPSVVAFSLARESLNGIALYDSYMALKAVADSRPVVYPEAEGEWNSDPLITE